MTIVEYIARSLGVINIFSAQDEDEMTELDDMLKCVVV